MPDETRAWYEKKRFLIPLIILFWPVGVAFLWAGKWPRAAKIRITSMMVALAGVSYFVEELTPPSEPAQTAQTEQPAPATPTRTIKPEHQDNPTFINPDNNQEYMVLTEPIGASGRLQLSLVLLESDETLPVITHCIDFQEQGIEADIQVNSATDIQATSKTMETGMPAPLITSVATGKHL